MAIAKKNGTVRDSNLLCPNSRCAGHITPVSMNRLRGDTRGETGASFGLRPWNNEDLVPRKEDVFQERLYCIRWIETMQENGKIKIVRHYLAPDSTDLMREQKVLSLLRERFATWQQQGYIPSRKIESG